MKPKLLDLFCGAGGAAMGYHRAGFEVVGVDIKPQPHYPFEFHQADALTYPLEGFDAYHASPPCQGYSVLNINNGHLKLIVETRNLLQSTNKPYAIENVEGAKKEMINPLMLCGTMFGLKVRRHRLFETNPVIYFPPMSCCHHAKVAPKGYSPVGSQLWYICGHTAGNRGAKEAMNCDWMKGSDEVSQAIPPAYTEYIGKYLMQAVLENLKSGVMPKE